MHKTYALLLVVAVTTGRPTTGAMNAARMNGTKSLILTMLILRNARVIVKSAINAKVM